MQFYIMFTEIFDEQLMAKQKEKYIYTIVKFKER